MPIHSRIFKKLILQELNNAQGQSTPIETFYQAANRDLKFDKKDMTPPLLKGKSTGEPSWKRNLRNSLQEFKSNGTVVNHTSGHWRLPSPNIELYLDPITSWELIKKSAQTAVLSKQTWQSPKDKNVYSIHSVSNEKIIINRHSSSTKAVLTQSEVERAIISINAAGGYSGRRTLNYNVAKETALVHLHPTLEWDLNFDWVKTSHLTNDISKEVNLKVLKSIVEAENDDEDYQSYARKIRKGQYKLRKNLLNLYNQKCCITNTGPENVLQAAHIQPHSIKGDNHTTNALLLRSDIHDLFDDDLILIEPNKLTVHIHPDLNHTVYADLNGTILRKRTDGERPSQQKLQEKWNNSFWRP